MLIMTLTGQGEGKPPSVTTHRHRQTLLLFTPTTPRPCRRCPEESEGRGSIIRFPSACRGAAGGGEGGGSTIRLQRWRPPLWARSGCSWSPVCGSRRKCCRRGGSWLCTAGPGRRCGSAPDEGTSAGRTTTTRAPLGPCPAGTRPRSRGGPTTVMFAAMESFSKLGFSATTSHRILPDARWSTWDRITSCSVDIRLSTVIPGVSYTIFLLLLGSYLKNSCSSFHQVSE